MTISQIPADEDDPSVSARIEALRDELGPQVTILAHHYQKDGVVRHSDHRGDSLELSRIAAKATSPHIVFCGVTFMAETAAVLCSPEQVVLQPAGDAPCPMARMVDRPTLQEGWDAMSEMWAGDLIPITYQNSTADVKAFVGEHGGAVCTSSNAGLLFRWALAKRSHLLFLPDEHLGTNAALAIGIPLSRIGLWDSSLASDPTPLRDNQVIVWPGYCYVHRLMTPEDVRAARERFPSAQVIVHPECPKEVVQLSDGTGSTAGIIKRVEAAEPGAVFVIGTEIHLVRRLANEHPDKTIIALREQQCDPMSRTTPELLLATLQSVADGRPGPVVSVPAGVAAGARLALERMLEAS
jgi:quinolinate synthase